MGTFQKAVKSKAKALIALFAASGFGKTFTALRMATGMAKEIERLTGEKTRIAAIDSEHGSISKYADRFDFDAVELQHKTIDEYIAYMAEAKRLGYKVLIIDSGTHAWQELLEDVDKLAKAKYRGNSFSAWSEGTPKQKKFIRAIYDFGGHLIFTMRSKTEWILVDGKDGKKVPSRQGLAPEQGKGIEYEFDMLIEMTEDHSCRVTKDRTGKFQDVIIDKPGEAFGAEIIAWLNDGAEKVEKPAVATAATSAPIVQDNPPAAATTAKAIDYTINPITKDDVLKKLNGKKWSEHSTDELMKAIVILSGKKGSKEYLDEIAVALKARQTTAPVPAAVPTAAAVPAVHENPSAEDAAIGPAFDDEVKPVVDAIGNGEDPHAGDDGDFFDGNDQKNVREDAAKATQEAVHA